MGLVVAAVYVTVFSGIIAFRMVPASEAMKENSHIAVAAWVTRLHLDAAIGQAVDDVRQSLLSIGPGGVLRPEDLATVTQSLRSLADSSWVSEALRALAGATVTARNELVLALADEAGSIAALARAAAELEAGRIDNAVWAVHHADSSWHEASRHLLEVEQPALFGMFQGERTVEGLAKTARRLVVWWALGSLFPFVSLGVLLRRRLYEPLVQLETALSRAAEGDLEVELPVESGDEMGRLRKMFNVMVRVLRDRSDEQQRRADNLQERLGRVLEQSANEILIFDAATLRFTQVSEGGRRNLGMTAEALAMRTPVDLLPDYDEATFAALLAPLVDDSRDKVVMRTALRRADGSTYPVEMIVQRSPLEDPPVFLAVVQDISERLRLETERERIFEVSVDLFVIAGINGVVLRANPACTRTLGWAKKELVGGTIFELVHPDDLAGVHRELRALVGGTPVRGFSVRLRGRDGQYRWISWNCDPPVDGVLYGVGRDVTTAMLDESRQLELRSAVERAAQEWTRTFDAIADPIMMVDREGRLLRLNEAARHVAGRHHRDLVGCPVRELGKDEFWRRCGEVVTYVQSTGRPTSSQVRSIELQTTWDLEASAVPGVGPEQAGAIIVVAHDITGLVRLQRSLRRNETMVALGSLLAGVAHEVRNPLFSMTATLDAFEARSGARDRYQPHLGILRAQLARLQQLMQELLEYGKPHALELAGVCVGSLIEQAIESTSVLAAEADVSVTTWCEGGMPQVQADRDRLIQVFTNLITNAIQFSTPGSPVVLRTHLLRQDGRHWLESVVRDTGPGFAEGDLAHAFEPFFTRRKGGTGLGLALVQRIVEQHGGQVTAENGDGGGATIRVRLPLTIT